MMGEGSEAPHIKIMRDTWLLLMNGMMPQVTGTLTPAFAAMSRKR